VHDPCGLIGHFRHTRFFGTQGQTLAVTAKHNSTQFLHLSGFIGRTKCIGRIPEKSVENPCQKLMILVLELQSDIFSHKPNKGRYWNDGDKTKYEFNQRTFLREMKGGGGGK
jgi:hypothetical protein